MYGEGLAAGLARQIAAELDRRGYRRLDPADPLTGMR